MNFHTSPNSLRNLMVCIDGSGHFPSPKVFSWKACSQIFTFPFFFLTDYADKAFKEALNFAKQGDKIYLYNVPELVVAPMPHGGQDVPDYKVFMDDAKNYSREVLSKYENAAKSKGFEVEPILGEQLGAASIQIVDAVDKHKVDVLFLGSRGKNALQRFLIGSKSDYCAHHANTTVVVVKDREAKK